MGRILTEKEVNSLDELLTLLGDPADRFARIYFACLDRLAATEDDLEAAELREIMERCVDDLARFGRKPERVDGEAKAVRKAF